MSFYVSMHSGGNEATYYVRYNQYISPSKTRKHNNPTSYHFPLYHQHPPKFLNAMKIEWASHFRSDGTRRRPPPSSTHGWLAKIRGTLIGNEELRSKGMREMKDAKARKRYAAKIKRQRAANSGRNLFSFLSFSKGKQSQPPNVISKRRTTSPKPSSSSGHQTGSRVRSPVRSPSGKPSPRHRATDSSYKSYRMPGHYDLSHPRRNNRRSTT